MVLILPINKDSMDECSTLLSPFVSDEEKKCLKDWPQEGTLLKPNMVTAGQSCPGNHY
jgi:hypothetical protein